MLIYNFSYHFLQISSPKTNKISLNQQKKCVISKKSRLFFSSFNISSAVYWFDVYANFIFLVNRILKFVMKLKFFNSFSKVFHLFFYLIIKLIRSLTVTKKIPKFFCSLKNCVPKCSNIITLAVPRTTFTYIFINFV